MGARKAKHWEPVKQNMGKLGRSGYGPNGYVPVNLLKALILQAWHNLSDEGLEEALRVRLDFMFITGLEKVPDHTTLYRFRNLLINQNLWEYLLAMINYQLEQKSFKDGGRTNAKLTTLPASLGGVSSVNFTIILTLPV